MTAAAPPVSPYGGVVRRILTELDAPPVIVDSISPGWAADAGEAPRAGCERPPGLGVARMWGRFDLIAWHTAAPHLLLSNEEDAADMAAAAQLLQRSGEGAQAWWAVDILQPGDLRIPWPLDFALAVTDLVCVGRPLGPETITAVSDQLAPLDWRQYPHVAPNEPVRHRTLTVCWTWWGYGA